MRLPLLLLSSCVLLLACGVLSASAAPSPLSGEWLSALQIDAEQIKQEAKLSLPSAASLRRQSLTSPLARLSSDPGPICKLCVGGVTDHLLKSYWSAVDRYCGDKVTALSHIVMPEAGAISKRCQWIYDNKEEFTGYLAATFRPVHDGYTYCMGAALCPHPPAPSSASQASRGTESSLFARDGATANDGGLLLSHQQGEASKHIAEQLRDFDVDIDLSGRALPFGRPGENPTFGRGFGYPHENPMAKADNCTKCQLEAVHYVMAHAGKWLEKKCAHTHCPYVRQACAWGDKHRPFVKGAIYASITPYRTAKGYCCGTGDCGKNRTQVDEGNSSEFDLVQPEPIVEVESNYLRPSVTPTIAPAMPASDPVMAVQDSTYNRKADNAARKRAIKQWKSITSGAMHKLKHMFD